jgi:threonine synthase
MPQCDGDYGRFLDFFQTGIIKNLPLIIGVQSTHANPVVKWKESGVYTPMNVKPSVAQAAMIGNPVSFPKVSHLVENYFKENFLAVSVTEQEIIEGMLEANRNGHIVCTREERLLRALKPPQKKGLIPAKADVVVDSTSHQLKFMNFQQMYSDSSFPRSLRSIPGRNCKTILFISKLRHSTSLLFEFEKENLINRKKIMKKIRIGVVGATSLTAQTLLKLLIRHPHVAFGCLRRKPGRKRRRPTSISFFRKIWRCF